MTVVQKQTSASRTLAGHAQIGGTDVPANGVTVELCSSNWKTVLASTKTDEKGYFSLENCFTSGCRRRAWIFTSFEFVLRSTRHRS
jgi:hypothetical protein